MIEKNQKILVACVIKELEKFELNIFIVNLIEMSKLICALCSKKLQEPKLFNWFIFVKIARPGYAPTVGSLIACIEVMMY